MIPHPLSVSALVLAVIEAALLGATVPRTRCSGGAAPALSAASHAAVDLPAVARPADPELDGAHAAIPNSLLQLSSASGGFLDAGADSLHAPVALTERSVHTRRLGDPER